MVLKKGWKKKAILLKGKFRCDQKMAVDFRGEKRNKFQDNFDEQRWEKKFSSMEMKINAFFEGKSV